MLKITYEILKLLAMVIGVFAVAWFIPAVRYMVYFLMAFSVFMGVVMGVSYIIERRWGEEGKSVAGAIVFMIVCAFLVVSVALAMWSYFTGPVYPIECDYYFSTCD